MPYELSFTKRAEIAVSDRYINECCIGGDVVSAALLPALKARYGNIETGEEACRRILLDPEQSR